MNLGHMLVELLEKMSKTVDSVKSEVINVRKDFTPEDVDTLKLFLEDFGALMNKYVDLAKTANRLPLADFVSHFIIDAVCGIQQQLTNHRNRFITNALYDKMVEEAGSPKFIKDLNNIAVDAMKFYEDIVKEKQMSNMKPIPIEDKQADAPEDYIKSQKEKAAEFLGMTPEEVDAELKNTTPSARDVMTETGEGDKPV